jgi:hypothetical protein
MKEFKPMLLVIACLCLVTAAKGEETCQTECPVISAAKAVGVSKDSLTKIEQLRNTFCADYQKLVKTEAGQTAQKALEAAQKAKDATAITQAEKALKETTKTAYNTFHVQAKEVLGKETYAKFLAKLPDWMKI